METQTENTSRLLLADLAYVDKNKGDLFWIIKQYFEQSGDRAATPGAVMLDMIQKVGKPDHLLIVHETDGKPDGFLTGKLIGENARILAAFLGPHLDNPPIIADAMKMFDDWARAHGCKSGDFYTHRHPKSYKNFKPLGWHHLYTIYRKEYEK